MQTNICSVVSSLAALIHEAKSGGFNGSEGNSASADQTRNNLGEEYRMTHKGRE